jgi:hypothetical protein
MAFSMQDLMAGLPGSQPTNPLSPTVNPLINPQIDRKQLAGDVADVKDAKNQKLAMMLYALGGALKGDKNFVQNTLAIQQMQEGKKKQEEREKAFNDFLGKYEGKIDPRITDFAKVLGAEKGASLVSSAFESKGQPNSYQEYLLTDPTPTSEEYSNFLNRSSGVGNLVQVVNRDGNFEMNVSKKDAIDRLDEFNKKGFKITQLPAGTAPPPTGGKIDPFKEQFIAGSNLISELGVLAENIRTTPEAANALVAGGANAIEFLKSNIEGFANIADVNKDNPVYQQVQKSPVSTQGTDFTDRISAVSGGSNLIKSQILDLAFLFAAARGQSGRGLSDRDFQNALDIISGGVNADQKIKIIQDISRRITSEYDRTVEVAKKLSADDQNFIDQLNALGSLPTLSISSSADMSDEDLINYYNK